MSPADCLSVRAFYVRRVSSFCDDSFVPCRVGHDRTLLRIAFSFLSHGRPTRLEDWNGLGPRSHRRQLSLSAFPVAAMGSWRCRFSEWGLVPATGHGFRDPRVGRYSNGGFRRSVRGRSNAIVSRERHVLGQELGCDATQALTEVWFGFAHAVGNRLGDGFRT